MSAAEPPQGANSAPAGGSAAAQPQAWGDHTSATLLSVAALAKSFDGIDAVRDVSFTVATGEVVAMIGRNGAGKTTCFNVIHGELAADRGDVRFDGHPLLGFATHLIAHRGIGRTFQVPATFASMTVRESIALALAAHDDRDRSVAAGMLQPRSARADALLVHLRIDDLADAHCAALAYGDAKRLELALALAGAPRLLLMDEPTAGMTARSRRDLMQFVRDIARRDALAVLFTEHDMDIVFGFADRIIVLDRGSIIAAGTPAEIRTNPAVQVAYLGVDECPPLGIRDIAR